jgi:hypothetical protein
LVNDDKMMFILGPAFGMFASTRTRLERRLILRYDCRIFA